MLQGRVRVYMAPHLLTHPLICLYARLCVCVHAYVCLEGEYAVLPQADLFTSLVQASVGENKGVGLSGLLAPLQFSVL